MFYNDNGEIKKLTIKVADGFTEEKINELYIEEEIEE